jgi:multidrug efflux pump subunit AcrA (membrane-fusion protein)
MTANIAFDVAADGATGEPFTLPVTALFHKDENPAVWVVRNGSNTLELRSVTIERYDERTVSVSSGLHDGDWVILQGVHAVSSGQQVQVVPPLHQENFPT